MNAPRQTQYIADGSAPVVTLAQARVNEIQRRLDEDLRPAVERLDDAITRKTEQLHSSWATHADHPERATRLQGDLEQSHRDRDLARLIVDGAERDLEVAQRQVVADSIAASRATADAHMLGSIDLAQQIVNHMAGSALLYRELLQRRKQFPAIFSEDRTRTGITSGEAMQPMNHTDLQPAVELIFEHILGAREWLAERAPFVLPAGSENKLVNLLETERAAILRSIDASLGQVTSTGTLGEAANADVHADGLAATQARAKAGAA